MSAASELQEGTLPCYHNPGVYPKSRSGLKIVRSKRFDAMVRPLHEVTCGCKARFMLARKVARLAMLFCKRGGVRSRIGMQGL